MESSFRPGPVLVAQRSALTHRDRLVLHTVETEDVHPEQTQQDSDRGQSDREPPEPGNGTLR